MAVNANLSIATLTCPSANAGAAWLTTRLLNIVALYLYFDGGTHKLLLLAVFNKFQLSALAPHAMPDW